MADCGSGYTLLTVGRARAAEITKRRFYCGISNVAVWGGPCR